MSEQNKLAYKPIKTAEKMKTIMQDYFLEMDNASKTRATRAEYRGKKIAWCTSVGPAELLRAFGFLVYFPENHAAMLGATRKAMEYIPLANNAGYSPDICSYLTSDIGAFLRKETPLKIAYGISSVPKPDVLVFNTNQCRDVQDWLEFYAKEFNVPIIGVEAPRAVGEVKENHIKYVSKQIQDMVPLLERISGKKFNMEDLKKTVSLSLKATKLWKEVLDTASHVPSPFTFFDATIHMAPAVVLRGTQTAVDYYKVLLAELKERITNNVAAIDGEKFRLYWEGMPIWGKLKDLSGFFNELNACVVASTYCNSWIFSAFDPKEPFDSMARAYTELFIVRKDSEKEKYIENMCNKFRIDGIIFHDSKTCPNNTNSRYGMPERLQEKLHIPTLTIHADLNDLRCYSEEQSKTNIEAFIEQISSRKSQKVS